MTYQRPHYQTLSNRLLEQRRFIQVVAGARQVGKTTLVQQVCEASGLLAGTQPRSRFYCSLRTDCDSH